MNRTEKLNTDTVEMFVSIR